MPDTCSETNNSRSIEVTPEMIEAGAMAFADGDLRFDSENEIVIRIYRAMVLKRPDRTKYHS
jgi:hypothetical protein